MKSLIFLVAILISSIASATETVYVINKSIEDIAFKILETACEVNVGKSPEIPQEIFEIDTVVTMYARPQQHYYKLEIKLATPVKRLWSFNKKLEVWGRGNKTIVRSTIDIGFGKHRKFPMRWWNVTRRFIIKIVERKILEAETSAIMKVIQ